jgi:hypothetical protein
MPRKWDLGFPKSDRLQIYRLIRGTPNRGFDRGANPVH